MKSLLRLSALSTAAGILLASAGPARAQLLITGNDEKVSFDENTGKTITHPAGKDTVSIIDIADPSNRLRKNTVFGRRCGELLHLVRALVAGRSLLEEAFAWILRGFAMSGQIPGIATPPPPPAWAAGRGCRQWQSG